MAGSETLTLLCLSAKRWDDRGTNEDPERQPHLTEPVPQTASDCRAVAGQGL